MYGQKELQSPPQLSQLSAVGKIAEQMAHQREIEQLTKAWLSHPGNKIEVVKPVHRWATVEEVMNTGYRLSNPSNLFRERHQRETWPKNE
jgi:hypothetical protein